MSYLILSILCSTCLMLGFKLFKQYEIDTFHAIVVNYITCVIIGLPLVQSFDLSGASSMGWIPLGFFLGCMFISLFFLIGVTTQKLGVSSATVSMKLGYVFPIILAFFYYNETINNYKIIGIALTVMAVILTSFRQKDHDSITDGEALPKYVMLFPLIIFLGSGLADSIVQFAQKQYFSTGGFEVFNIILFATASLIGLVIALFKDRNEEESRFNRKNIIAGVLLGIPNYGSIYFLFKSLNTNGWESSMVFPVNNIGIVVASTAFAVILFKEKMSWINVLGFGLAIISILLMAPALRELILSIIS